MPLLLCMGTLLQCRFGSVPTPLAVLPTSKVSGFLPYANINDHIPVLNILPFGVCNSMLNPAVAAAKLLGLTAPCVPLTMSPWTKPAQKVKVGTAAAITKDSKLMCFWGGEISVKSPGQPNVTGA